MKPIIFYGTIEEGSSTLIAQSSKEYYSIDNTFSIKVNDSGFNIQKIEKMLSFLFNSSFYYYYYYEKIKLLIMEFLHFFQY